jgi:chitin synthase
MIGMLIQIGEDGLFAPSSVFILVVSLQILVAGIVHPQEFFTLLCGVVYYITIPSMYMLLVIYSIFNMNDVSWGTRENPKRAEEKTPTKKATHHTSLQKILGFLHNSNNDEENGSLDIYFAGLFRCMFCTHPKSTQEQDQLAAIAISLNKLNEKMQSLEMKLTGKLTDMEENQSTDDEHDHEVSRKSLSSRRSIVSNEIGDHVSSIYLPDWLYDEKLKKGNIDSLSSKEEQFWIDLIEKYLKPLEMSPNIMVSKVYNQLRSCCFKNLSLLIFRLR